MIRSATSQQWHQEYALLGWIPTEISIAVTQIRAGEDSFGAFRARLAFAEDFPRARSPVDFR
jgi:hypothetical protein